MDNDTQTEPQRALHAVYTACQHAQRAGVEDVTGFVLEACGFESAAAALKAATPFSLAVLDALPPRFLRHATDAWHDLQMTGDTTATRVCEHWHVREVFKPTPVLDRLGRQVHAGPGVVRSYVGLIIEVGELQVQVRGRLRHGDERLELVLDDPDAG